MKNQIYFTTGLFDSGHVGLQTASDLHAGKDLANWLATKSKGGEFKFGDPVDEGDRWAETVTAEGETFNLGFGIVEGSAGADHAEWCITVDKVRKWNMFSSKDSPLRGRLCDLIHNILRDEGHIREVRWTD